MLADLPNELLEAVAEFLESERDINALIRTDRHFFTLLDPILYRRNVKESTEIVSSALFWAADQDRPATARKAIEAGGDSDDIRRDEILPWTALAQASRSGHLEIVRMLLHTGSTHSHRRPYDRGTPISLAVRGGHIEVVRELLVADGVDPDFIGNDSYSPLMIAARAGYADIAELLINSGKVDPGKEGYRGRTAISFAAQAGHARILGMLLQSGRGDADCQDSGGKTPLCHAARRGNADGLRLLLEHGANAELSDWAGQTPLYAATQASGGQRNGEVIKLLLDSGRVDVDSQATGGATLLANAVTTGYTEAVKTLLGSGRADPRVRDECGWTPLHHAAMVYHPKPGDRVAEPELVAEATSGGIVEQLLQSEKGCDIGATDDQGKTALWHAAQNNWLAIGERLMEKGSQYVHVRDNDGLSPLDIAIREGHGDFVKLLQQGMDRVASPNSE